MQATEAPLFFRLGLACVYCGDSVDHGAILTLDHIRPHSSGGTNTAVNLVTACKRCNCSRGKRGLVVFARVVAAYLDHGVAAEEIVEHVRATVARPIDLEEAKQLIARRGSAARVMAAATPEAI